MAQTAHETHLKNAERGVVESMRYVAFVNIVNKNYTEACNWFEKAAILGDGPSQNSLGRSYEDGLGVAKDINQAVKWYLKSADNNCPMGISSLADCYAEGKGVKTDKQKAKELYTKSIELGDIGGKGGLAQLLFLEEDDKSIAGEEADFTEALKLARDAAENNDVRGILVLGCCYYSPYGVPQDFAKAIQYLERGAEMGRDGFLSMLADCYEKLGKYDSAYMWYNIAEGICKAEVSRDAAMNKFRIAVRLTGREIEDAQGKSSLWVKKFRDK
jgi:TPR repeat protein